MIVQHPVGKRVAAAIEQVVKQEMRAFGIRSVQVSPAEDHDGDPVLRVDVQYGHGGEPIDPAVVAGLVTKLRDRLWKLGEARFPHVRHHFSEDQRVIERA